MAILTRDEVAYLSQFDSQIQAAVKGGYYRGIGRDSLLEVNAIREKYTGRKYNLCTNCASDAYDLMCKVGEWYYESIEHYKEADKTEAEKTAKAAIKKAGKVKGK